MPPDTIQKSCHFAVSIMVDILFPHSITRVVFPLIRRFTVFVLSEVFIATSTIDPSGFFAAVISISRLYTELAIHTAFGLIYCEKCAIA